MKTTLTMGWIALLMSLLIAACAAYFSITGLAVLFAAALIPVIIMATTLELGKLGATFFLHHFWDEIPWKIKYPLAGMVIILMLITSMGIFGFLSKGHIEQETPTVELSIDIQDADEDIKQHKDRIKILKDQMDQLNGALNKLLEFSKVSGKTGYLASKKELQPQLLELEKEINQEQDRIKLIRESKTSAQREISGIEAKLGPIKYVAELFGYDLSKDPSGKGKAVRIVIVLFMVAFDPFAIFLIMAADWAFLRYKKERSEVKVEEENNEINKLREENRELLGLQLENEDLKTTIQSHIEQEDALGKEIFKEITEVYEAHEMIVNTKDEEIRSLTEMLETADTVEHVVFKEIEVPVEVPVNIDNAEHIHDLEHALITLEIQLEEKTMELNEFLATLEKLDENLSAKPTEVEKIVEIEDTAALEKLQEERDEILETSSKLENKLLHSENTVDHLKLALTEQEDMNATLKHEMDAKDIDLGKAAETIEERNAEISELQSSINTLREELNTARNDIEARDKAVENLNNKYQLIERVPGIGIVADNVEFTPGATSFGTEYPQNPTKGQRFLRVDSMPSTLYEYEGSRWIEAVKTNDVEYDEQYLQHLINELGDNKVELDELSEKEQEEIANLLSKEDVLGK